MDQRTESIRQEIDQTRESMAEKIEQIESQVYGTVDDVKQSAYDTVDRVKEQFNVQRIVNERPWAMFGASMLAGFVLGTMIGSDESHHSYDYERGSRRDYGDYDPRESYRYLSETSRFTEHPTPPPGSREASQRSEGNGGHGEQHYGHESDRLRAQREYAAAGPSRSRSGFMSSMQDQFGGEIEALRQAAITTATSTLRNMLKENLPQFAEEFDRARQQQEQHHRSESHPEQGNQEGSEWHRRAKTDVSTGTPTIQAGTTPASMTSSAETGREGTPFDPAQQSGTPSSGNIAPQVEKRR